MHHCELACPICSLEAGPSIEVGAVDLMIEGRSRLAILTAGRVELALAPAEKLYFDDSIRSGLENQKNWSQVCCPKIGNRLTYIIVGRLFLESVWEGVF
jgi:hypothetical protein